MCEEHPSFTSPSNPSVPIWRYMDLAKLVSLLHTNALWFARADTLGDPHEGSISPKAISLRPADVPTRSDGAIIMAEAHRQMATIRLGLLRHTFVNCWHMSSSESMAMWTIYAAAGQGVAVRSTFDRFRDSMRTDEATFIGMVKYIDPVDEAVPDRDVLAPYVYKRRAYEYERELRAIIQAPPVEDGRFNLAAPSAPGLMVEVNIAELVSEIVVAPGQDAWYADAVTEVVRAFSPTLTVRRSALDVEPVY